MGLGLRRPVTENQRAVAAAIVARWNGWNMIEAELLLERIGAVSLDETSTSVMRRLNPLTPSGIAALEQVAKRIRFPESATDVPIAPPEWQPRRVQSRAPKVTPGQLRIEWGPVPVRTIAQGAVELRDDGPLPHIARLRDPDGAVKRVQRGRLASDRIGCCSLCGEAFERNTFGRPAVRCPGCRRQTRESA